MLTARPLLLLFFCWSAVHAQTTNLVQNPGFEESSSCPGGFSEASHEFRVTHWHAASMGTPDHFHSCSAGEADVPYNWAGVSEAFSGDGYAGIYLWMNSDNSYREYLQTKLTEPLRKDSIYHIEFHYKLSSYSKYAIDRIGLLLSDSAVSRRNDKPLEFVPTLSVIQDTALTENTGLWEKASMAYRARGGEQYLTLGNFFNNESTHYYEIQFRPISQLMLAHSAYYYIDDVKVVPDYLMSKPLEIIPGFAPDAVLNKTYVLETIKFEFDSYKLEPESFDELDRVVEYLIRHPKANVQLAGHTDDQGGDRYNDKLSTNRAASVARYLIYAGIRKDRLETMGFGKRKPLIPEKTEAARGINRRVEVRFFE